MNQPAAITGSQAKVASPRMTQAGGTAASSDSAERACRTRADVSFVMASAPE